MAAPGQEEDRDQDTVGEKKIINRTFLSLSQITALSEQNVEGVQKKLEEFLNFKQLKTSLKEGILLDYYTAGFWWAKERNFSVIQLSGFMDLLNFLLENLSDKHMTLGDNLKELGKAMAGIGETDSERNGDLKFFSIEQAKAVIDYLNISLFKHYKLYEYLFHSPREELVISNESCENLPCLRSLEFWIDGGCGQVSGTKRLDFREQYFLLINDVLNLKIKEIVEMEAFGHIHHGITHEKAFNVYCCQYVVELAQPSVPPFPPLLEDGIPSDIYSSFIISPTATETESKGSDQEDYLEEPCPEVESFEADAVAGVTAEDQKSAVGEIPSEIIGNLEAEINEKLQMQEEAYTLRTEKLESPK